MILPGKVQLKLGLGVILLFAFDTKLEAEEITSQDWSCQRCLSTAGWELDIKAGPAYVGDDAYHFGDYTGLDEKGLYLFSDVFARYWGNNANFLTIEGFNRGLEAGAFFIEGGKQSVYKLRASYRAIPRRAFNSTVAPYLGNGGNHLSLPASWVRGSTTQQMTTLEGATTPVEIKRDWDIYKIGFDINAAQRWQVQVDYAHHQRSGVNRSSGSYLFNAVEISTPVDYSTDDIELALAYSADWWQTSLTYFGSIFRNDNQDLRWDNPYTSAAGADSGQLAMAPDNASHQVSLAGSMLLPARTTLNGQLSFGHISQDESLLPYTTNSSLGTNPLPVTSASAAADTININLRAVSSPLNKVTVEGEIRYNDYNNKTPVNEYHYVNTDTAQTLTSVHNRPYDYTRRVFKLRSEYRLNYSMKFHAGYDNRRFDRSHQDRSKTTTNRLWFRFRSLIGTDADVNFDIFTEHRDGSHYSTVNNPAAPENPLMRKYNMADRYRDGIKLRGSFYGGNSSDVGWELEYNKDRYNNSTLGLTDSEYIRVGADFSWLFTRTASTYVSFFTEQVENEQRNSQSFSQPDWSATTDDSFLTGTVGLAYPRLIGSMDASIEYSLSHSVGEIDNNTSGLPSSFPDLVSKRQNIKLGLSYPYSKSISLTLDYLYERYESSDWALEGVNPDTVSNLLAMSANPYNYNVSILYVGVRYQLEPK